MLVPLIRRVARHCGGLWMSQALGERRILYVFGSQHLEPEPVTKHTDREHVILHDWCSPPMGESTLFCFHLELKLPLNPATRWCNAQLIMDFWGQWQNWFWSLKLNLTAYFCQHLSFQHFYKEPLDFVFNVLPCSVLKVYSWRFIGLWAKYMMSGTFNRITAVLKYFFCFFVGVLAVLFLWPSDLFSSFYSI